MKDERKTKKQLIGELDSLRQRLTELETNSKGVAAALRESEASKQSILKAAPIGIGLVHNRVLGWVSDHMNKNVKSFKNLPKDESSSDYESMDDSEEDDWAQQLVLRAGGGPKPNKSKASSKKFDRKEAAMLKKKKLASFEKQ